MKKLLLPTLLLIAQPAFPTEEALTQCRQIEDIGERVVCYDYVVDSRDSINPRNSVQPATPPELAESTAIPDAQSLFGTNDAEAKRIVETTFSIEQIEQIEARVTDVHKSATRKLTVTLDNGQVWRQLDNKSLRLKSGEAVIIRKASFSSYLMEKETGSRGIRVKRVN